MSEPSPSDGRYDPSDFARRLAAGEFQSGPRLVGFTQSSDRPDHIQFSSGDDCEHWVDLPLSIIQDIHLIEERRCRDHTHPYVVLLLRLDHSAEVAALASLLERPASDTGLVANRPVAGRCLGRHPRCPSHRPCAEYRGGRYICTNCCIGTEADELDASSWAAAIDEVDPFVGYAGTDAGCRPPLQACGPYCYSPRTQCCCRNPLTGRYSVKNKFSPGESCYITCDRP